MSYRIGRGEHLVLTFEPYKSALLPHWRFRTAALARTSSQILWSKFLAYDAAGDFVGMDMTRKFLQMGMTRAKRYANHQGGRKYREDGKEKEKGLDFAGKREKEEASMIFREMWEKAKVHEGYQRRKVEFLKEQKEWDRTRKLEGRNTQTEKSKENDR